jgi:hypothetical protein
MAQHDVGFGGFPGPIDILASLFARVAPALVNWIWERVFMQCQSGPRHSLKTGSYCQLYKRAGRNSQGLTEEVLEELGVEYRAIKILRPLIIAVGLTWACLWNSDLLD